MKRAPKNPKSIQYIGQKEYRTHSSRDEQGQRVRSYSDERELYERSRRAHSYRTEQAEQPGYERENIPVTNKRYTRRYQRELQARLEKQKNEDIPKRKKSRIKTVFKTALVLLLAVIAAGMLIWFVPGWKAAMFKWILKTPLGPVAANAIIGKNYEAYVHDKDFDESSIIINEGVSTPKGYITLALLGVDARTQDLTRETMADSMIVLNIDPAGTIQMNSVYRDTYLLSRNEDGSEVISKANSSYFRFGPKGTVNMLNENWDLAITDYVVVNFWGLENIIDILGGLRLKITGTERERLNYYMQEQCYFGNTEYVPLELSGDDVLLNGAQATAFCRLRDCSFVSPLDDMTYSDDYARTARQRYALTELIKQSKEKGMLNLLTTANELFKANNGEKKFIQTSLTISELCRILSAAYDMNIGENRAYPDMDHQYNKVLDAGDSIVADTLEENVTLMHEFMYGQTGYTPTDALKDTADKIRAEVDRQ